MGSFGGHALPGSFFLIFAFWWTVRCFHRFFRFRLARKPPQEVLPDGACEENDIRNPSPSQYTNTPTFKVGCRPCGVARTLEIEGALKLFFCVVGISLEIYTAFKDGRFAYLGNGQHATMFLFYGMSGAVDLAVHAGVPVPGGAMSQYAASAIAIFVEGVLFKFHLHGRSPLDVLIHTLLLYSIGMMMVATLLEMRFRHNPLAALLRFFTVALHGLWFWAIAFILYNPTPGATPWDPQDHEQMMVATMMFTWCLGGALVVMLLIGLFVYLYLRRCHGNRYCEGDGHQKIRLLENNNYDI